MKILGLLLLICLVVGAVNANRIGRRSGGRSRGQSKRSQNVYSTENIIIESTGKFGMYGVDHILRPILSNKIIKVNNGATRNNKDRNQNLLERLGYTRKVVALKATSMETLLKQKFLLDVLLNVNGALMDKELQKLGETIILDEQHYIGGLDTEMLQLLELCLNNEMLRKTDKFNALNSGHVKQMLGLYKLLVRAIDWETFQRNVCFARLHLNGELLVNALLLAVRERNDTMGLIIPGIHEILPELYYDKQLLQRAKAIDIDSLVTLDKKSVKPQLLDIIKPTTGGGGRMQPQKSWQEWRQAGVARQSSGFGSSMQNPARGGIQPQKTWQEWRQERLDRLAQLEKFKQTERDELDTPVLPVSQVDNNDVDESISYLTHDIGLNNFWYSFNIEGLHKMNIEIPTSTKTIKIETVKNLEIPEIVDIANTDRLLYINRQRIGEESRVPQNILLSDLRSPQVQVQSIPRIFNSQETVNRKEVKTTDIKLDEAELSKPDNTARLLKVNRRRLNQNVPSGTKQDTKERIPIDVTKDLPQTSLNNERLLRVNRRRLNQGVKSIGTEERRQSDIGNQKDLRNSEVLSPRVDVESTQRTIDLVQDLRETSLKNERLLRINRRRLNQDVNSIGTEERKSSGNIKQKETENLQVVGQKVNIKSMQSADENRNIDLTKDLRQTSLNNERLLRINRRRLNQNNSGIRTEEARQSSSGNQKETENSEVVGQRTSDLAQTSLNNERLLRINRRKLNQDLDIIRTIEGRQTGIDIQKGIKNSQVPNQSLKVDSMNTPEKVGTLNKPYNIQNNLAENAIIDKGLKDGEIQKDLEQSTISQLRLLKINRRRRPIQNVDESIQRDVQNVDEDAENMPTLGRTSERLLKVSRRRNPEARIIIEDKRLMKDNNLLLAMGKQQRTELNEVANALDDILEDSSDSSSAEVEMEQEMSTTTELPRDLKRLGDILQSDSLRARIPRSIRNSQNPANIRNFNLREQRAGEIMLTTLRQMLVRLKMERLTNTLEDKKTKTNNPINRQKLLKLLNQTKDIEQMLDFIIKTELKNTKNVNFLEVIGEVLMGRRSDIGQHLLEYLASIMETNGLESDFTTQLSGPFSLILERIITIIDAYADNLNTYDSADLTLDGIKLNDVKVDKLQTFFDTTDAALLNLLFEQKAIDLKNLRTVPVARQRRLNHKPFTLKFDITNEGRAKRSVVIRIFLGSKLDSDGQVISFEDNRHNFLLLDAFTTVLPKGHIAIERKSTDITWTSNDSTSYLEIYQKVMLAIDGKMNLQLENLLADNCKFPQRLLLPRGLAQGLPMQLFAIVTPVTEADAKLQREVKRIGTDLCGMGIAAIKLDKLPLGFPLDSNINNVKLLLSKNAILKDVLIYHEIDAVVRDIKN